MTWNAKQPLLWLFTTFITLLVFWVALYPERMLQLHTHWTTADDLDMGYLLLALFFYFSTKNLSKTPSNTNLYLLPLTIFISCAFFISEALDLKTLFFLSLALIFPLCVAIILGFEKARSILIPWGIVMMAMPFWYLAIPILQTITVKVVSSIADSISLTVLVEGNYFTIPTGVVHVAGGCSGLKYFISSISIALISSSLNQRSIARSFISLVFAGLFAMLGNWIRVFILLLIGYIEGVDHPLMTDHDTLGWIVFAVVMTPWFFIDKFLDSPATNISSDLSDQKDKSPPPSPSTIKSTCALLACFVLLVGTQHLIKPPQASADIADTIQLPQNLNEMHLSTIKSNSWTPNYPPTTATSSGHYTLDGERLDAYVLSYFINGREEMANSTNTIFDKNHWQLISDNSWQSKTNTQLKIRIAQAKSGLEHRIVYYWYKHGSKFANSILSSKIAQLKGAYNDIYTAQLIAISKKCNIHCQQNSQPEKAMEEIFIDLHSNVIANN